MTDDRLVLHGSFTSSSTYKPMLFLALARLPFSFKTVNLKTGAQKACPTALPRLPAQVAQLARADVGR